MTPYEANHYFETLPEGFAPAEELRAALPAAVQQVQFAGVAGTAGKAASWLWWSCRMPVWQRLCPPCRSAR